MRLSFRPLVRLMASCQNVVLFFAIILFGPVNAHAVAFRLPNQDPEGIARGNAFVATADNPSAIYYNPAGITQLKGKNFSMGMYLVSADTEFTSTTGIKANTDAKFQPVPQIYYVQALKDLPISIGLGVYAPYGLSLDWGQNTPFRTRAETGRLLYSCINPVVAWQVCPKLSLGIGPTINYSEAKLVNGIGILPGDEFLFQGDGIDYGFNAGLLWQPHQKWSFGASYRYLTTVEYNGHSEAFPYFAPWPSSTTLRFPQFFVAGVSFRPTENWNIEFNIDWTDWDNVNQAVFTGTSFGSVPFVFNYRSSFMYEFGVTRKLPKGWFVSGGYFYSENSIPDSTFNPIVPDGNLHLFSAGVGRKGKRWDWAVAYHCASNFDGRVVKGSAAGVDGTYRTFNQAFNVSATLKF
jgi:long-chain fatty acid transport protein